MTTRVDHFMYAIASLDEGTEWAADTFGVAPAYGVPVARVERLGKLGIVVEVKHRLDAVSHIVLKEVNALPRQGDREILVAETDDPARHALVELSQDVERTGIVWIQTDRLGEQAAHLLGLSQ